MKILSQYLPEGAEEYHAECSQDRQCFGPYFVPDIFEVKIESANCTLTCPVIF
jgi:hypothetical protein